LRFALLGHALQSSISIVLVYLKVDLTDFGVLSSFKFLIKFILFGWLQALDVAYVVVLQIIFCITIYFGLPSKFDTQREAVHPLDPVIAGSFALGFFLSICFGRVYRYLQSIVSCLSPVLCCLWPVLRTIQALLIICFVLFKARLFYQEEGPRSYFDIAKSLLVVAYLVYFLKSSSPAVQFANLYVVIYVLWAADDIFVIIWQSINNLEHVKALLKIKLSAATAAEMRWGLLSDKLRSQIG